MSGEPRVRVAAITLADVEPYRIARLRALREEPTAFSELHDRAAAEPPEFWRTRVAENAASETSTTVLAWRDSSVVGMVSGLRGETPETAELVSMWVAPEARRLGLGRTLIDHVVDWARGRGAGALELWVTSTNTAAISLYDRYGFATKPEHRASPNDPCRDETRMRLDI